MNDIDTISSAAATIEARLAHKHCPHCDTRLPASAFASNPNRSGGLNSWCKSCTADLARRRRQTAEGRASYAAATRRYRARKRAERLAAMDSTGVLAN